MKMNIITYGKLSLILLVIIFCIIFLRFGFIFNEKYNCQLISYDVFHFCPKSANIEEYGIRNEHFEKIQSTLYIFNSFHKIDSFVNYMPDRTVFSSSKYYYTDELLDSTNLYTNDNKIWNTKIFIHNFLKNTDSIKKFYFRRLSETSIVRNSATGCVRTILRYSNLGKMIDSSIEARNIKGEIVQFKMFNQLSGPLVSVSLKYDFLSNVIQEKSEYGNSLFSDVYTYRYISVDEKGNWTKVKVYRNNKWTKIIKRIIYY